MSDYNFLKDNQVVKIHKKFYVQVFKMGVKIKINLNLYRD